MRPDTLRSCLIEMDLERLRKLSAHIWPAYPQPRTDAELLETAHYARTQTNSIPLRYRAYSHRWLLDHGLPSGLPDWLKPRAERICPRIVDAVGIAVLTPPARRELGNAIQSAMIDVVENHYADGIRDPVVIHPRMLEAREQARKRA